MRNRLDDLWQKIADDGASMPLGIDVVSPRDELEGLMKAWFHERGQKLEMELLLRQSRRLIARLAAGDCVSARDRRMAKSLLAAIKCALRNPGPDQS